VQNCKWFLLQNIWVTCFLLKHTILYLVKHKTLAFTAWWLCDQLCWHTSVMPMSLIKLKNYVSASVFSLHSNVDRPRTASLSPTLNTGFHDWCVSFVGCIECMQCMRWSLLCCVCPSVCLFVSLSSLCKMAEQIKMLFGVNTRGGPWNIVLDVGPDPPQTGGGEPTRISGMAATRDWNIAYRGLGTLTKIIQK